MKTILKLQLIAVLLCPALCLSAQTDTTKKTCVNIDIVENGKETKIDTCFTIPGLDSLQNVFKDIHFEDIIKELSQLSKETGGLNMQIDSSDGPDGNQERVIINEKDSNGNKELVKIISNKNGSGRSVIISSSGKNNTTSANAYNYNYSTSGSNKMIIKNSKNGACTIIIKEGGGDANPKEAKKMKRVKMVVYKKVEVKPVSKVERKKLTAEMGDTSINSHPFTNLVMSPNPTQGNVRITYKTASTQPLFIKVFDAYGKKVLTESYNDLGNNVDETISLMNLSKGIYFVQLIQGNQSEVRKVVIR